MKNIAMRAYKLLFVCPVLFACGCSTCNNVSYNCKTSFLARSTYPFALEFHSDVDIFHGRTSRQGAKIFIKLNHPALDSECPLAIWIETAYRSRLEYLWYISPWCPFIMLKKQWDSFAQWMCEDDGLPEAEAKRSGWSAGRYGFSRSHKLAYGDKKFDGEKASNWTINIEVVNVDFPSFVVLRDYMLKNFSRREDDYILVSDGIYIHVDCNSFRRRWIWVRVETYTVNGKHVHPNDVTKNLSSFLRGELHYVDGMIPLSKQTL